MCSEQCPYIKDISVDERGHKRCRCEIDDSMFKPDRIKNIVTGDLWWCLKLQAMKQGRGISLCLQREAPFWLLDKYEARKEEIDPLLVVPKISEIERELMDIISILTDIDKP